MEIKHLLFVIGTLIGAIFSSEAANTEHLYVKAGGTGDGTSWEKALGSVEAAIDLTSDNCQKDIWVAEGTYQMTKRVTIPTTVSLYGGFTGTENALEERNIAKKSTLQGGEFSTLKAPAMTSEQGTATIDGFIFTGTNKIDFEDGVNGNFELYSNRIISNCIIKDNAYAKCGTIYTNGNASIINCLIYNNNTTQASGTVCMAGDNGKMINCTIVKNYGANNSWGGLRISGSKINIYNTIIWGNTKDKDKDGIQQPYQVRCDKAGYGNFTNCAIQGELTGGSVSNATPGPMVNFIDLNPDNTQTTGPGFVDPANNDYQLLASSILVNAGSNSDAAGLTSDLIGNQRVQNNTIDLGAYEFGTAANMAVTQAAQLICYPNPVKDQLTVNAEGASKIEIYNIAGTLILQQPLTEHTQINLSGLNAGCYEAVIYTANGKQCTSIIKE